MYSTTHQQLRLLVLGAFFSALPASGQRSLVTDNTVHHRSVSCKKLIGRENLRVNCWIRIRDNNDRSSDALNWKAPGFCQGSLSWVVCNNGDYPVGAVKAGLDKDGGTIYVGRGFYEGDLLPAKVTPSHECAFVSYGGKEIRRNEYEVLVSESIAWKPSSGGDVPSQAIQIGYTADGEALYYGRVFYEGSIQPGKVHPSHGCVYVPYGEEELSFTDYEVLILV